MICDTTGHVHTLQRKSDEQMPGLFEACFDEVAGKAYAQSRRILSVRSAASSQNSRALKYASPCSLQNETEDRRFHRIIAGLKRQKPKNAKKAQKNKKITQPRPTLPGPFDPSTIGAKELNFCVRHGNRCILLAIVTA